MTDAEQLEELAQRIYELTGDDEVIPFVRGHLWWFSPEEVAGLKERYIEIYGLSPAALE